MHVRLGVIAPANARLVGDDEQPVSGIHQTAQGRAAAGDDLELIGVVQIMPLHIERAVAIEESGVKQSILVRTGYGAELEQAEPTLVARAALVDDVVGAADWILEQA